MRPTDYRLQTARRLIVVGLSRAERTGPYGPLPGPDHGHRPARAVLTECSRGKCRVHDRTAPVLALTFSLCHCVCSMCRLCIELQQLTQRMQTDKQMPVNARQTPRQATHCGFVGPLASMATHLQITDENFLGNSPHKYIHSVII